MNSIHMRNAIGIPFEWVHYGATETLASLLNYQSLLCQKKENDQKSGKRRESACLWFATHYRERANKVGVQAAARQLRKQGVPCEVAVAILATR